MVVMKLKLREILIIAIVTVTSFPILYTALLFMTGTAKVVFETEKATDTEDQKKLALMKQSVRKDSLSLANSRTFQALQKERAEMSEQKERIKEQQQRLDILQQELEGQRREIVEQREKFEKLVEQSDSLDMKKMRDLAKMYGAMKPAEAAQILETMSTATIAKILRMINDDRQKAKILASMSTAKAAEISKLFANSGSQ
jgi:flagellar motility protein MotE (MotC chaperone)